MTGRGGPVFFFGERYGRLLGHHRCLGRVLAGVLQGMNIKRVFVNAIARRVSYLVVAAVLAWFGVGEAHAQNCGPLPPFECPQSANCDQGKAYANAMAWATVRACEFGYTAPRAVVNFTGMYVTLGCYADNSSGTAVTLSSSCAHYLASKSCSTRSALQTGWKSSAGSHCSDGCAFTGSTGTTTMVVAGKTYQSLSGWTPTGSTCAYGEGDGGSVDQDDCTAVSGLTQCVKPDGRHCAVSSTGKQFCWSPAEAGVKASGNEGATKSPVNTNVNVPPKSPTNGGDWEQSGQGTSSTTVGGSTTNYNITNWSSTYGPEGSGGTGSGDGEGEGEGDGHGTIGGDGECGGSFTCTGGDPVLCAIAKQQYLARCEGKSRFDGDAASFPGNGDGGAGEDPDPAETHKTVGIGVGMLDETGFGAGSACPVLPTFQVWGMSIDFDPDGKFCRILAVVRACFILLGAFLALRILMGG